MRIGIDNISPGASTGPGAIGGMRHFLESLATQLPEQAPAQSFELFTPAWNIPFAVPSRSNLLVTPCRGVPRQPVGRVLYEQTYLPRRLRQRGVDVWLASCNTLPLAWLGPSVLIVQSLQYLTHPEAFSWPRRTYLRRIAVASIRRATRLVTFSHAAKADIVERVGVPASKITVIPHAVRFTEPPALAGDDSRMQAAIRTTVDGANYILCVSGFYPYKNLPRLIEAFARLETPRRYKLVLAGAETPAVSRADLTAAASRLGVADDVIFVGRVSDAQLSGLYRHAAVMAMPSLEETFGLPVLEAMALGCPVVTSNLSSMPEIAGDAAVLVNPLEVDSIADGLRRVLTSEETRQRLIDAGRARAGEFTYARFFQQLWSVIEGVAP